MEKIEIFCCGKMETKQWKKAYIDQLTRKEEKGLGVYRDMDTSYTDKDSRYYAQLTAFLNKREDDLSDKLCGKYEYKFNQVEGKLHGMELKRNGIYTYKGNVMNENCKRIILSEEAHKKIVAETFSYGDDETGGVLIGYICPSGQTLPGYWKERYGL